MFKNQGLFSSFPCPLSPGCASKHCIFKHPDQGTSPKDVTIASTIIQTNRPSGSDDGQSNERRLIERSSSSSPPSQRGNIDQEFPSTSLAQLSSVSDPPESSSATTSNMLEVISKAEVRSAGNMAINLPLVNRPATLGRNDMKRKYTDTFNLAAQEFVPSNAGSTSTSPTPIIDPGVHPSINGNVRHVPLDMIYKTYKELYSTLPNCLALAARDAAQEELSIAKGSCNAQAYKVSWRQMYARLKKRSPVTEVKDACTLHDLELRRIKNERMALWTAPLTCVELSPLVESKDGLSRWGYIISPPPPRPFKIDAMSTCHRCTTKFTQRTRTQLPCISHYGKQIGSFASNSLPNLSDGKSWNCCQTPVGSRGCTTHPCHVRKVSNPGELAAIRPFVELDPFVENQHLPIVSLDCEMAYTLHGMELVRLTVLDHTDRLVFDVLVRPETEITDFNTRFSGVTQEHFENGKTISFEEAIEMLKLYVSRSTIIVGHGLENDLVALRLIHHSVVDTALLYPHPRGRPYRLGLKDLVKRETGLDIQTAGEEGHSSMEDAAAASLLVRKRARGDVFPGIGNVKVGVCDGVETL